MNFGRIGTYQGMWKDNAPHGQGTFSRVDGMVFFETLTILEIDDGTLGTVFSGAWDSSLSVGFGDVKVLFIGFSPKLN